MNYQPVQAGHEQDDSDPRGYEAFKASLRKAADKCETRRQKAKEYFGKPENLVSVATLIFVGGYTIVSWRQLIEMQNQTVEANRAWIAPLVVSLNTTGKVGDTIAPGIGYENVGKGPALQLNWQFDDGYVDYPLGGDARNLQIPVNKTCENLRPDPAGFVEFPFSNLSDPQKTMHVKYGTPTQRIDTEWIENKHWYFVQGCVAYSTMNRTGFTRFCFALEVQRTPNGRPRINSDGEPVYNYFACSGDYSN